MASKTRMRRATIALLRRLDQPRFAAVLSCEGDQIFVHYGPSVPRSQVEAIPARWWGYEVVARRTSARAQERVARVNAKRFVAEGV